MVSRKSGGKNKGEDARGTAREGGERERERETCHLFSYHSVSAALSRRSHDQNGPVMADKRHYLA